MNYYFDDPPECCGDCMEVLANGDCKCPECGEVITVKQLQNPDIDPPDSIYYE